MTAQIFLPHVGRRYLVHVREDEGWKFIGRVVAHDEETVTLAPCRHLTDDMSALRVSLLPDEYTVSRLNAVFEEWL